MQVILLPEVVEYLEDLATILYEKGYFEFEETSLGYVIELYDEIKTSLLSRLHKPAPPRFDKYGEDLEYAAFKKNKRTTWYVFFRIYKVNNEEIYQVRYIGNNHTIAQYL